MSQSAKSAVLLRHCRAGVGQWATRVKLCRINRNPSAVHQRRGRADVWLFLHLYSGQIASRSKTFVPARLGERFAVWQTSNPVICNWMTRCAIGCPVAQQVDG